MTERKIYTKWLFQTKRATVSLNNSQWCPDVKTISVLSKTNLILGSAQGAGWVKTPSHLIISLHLNPGGLVYLTFLGHFSYPENQRFLHNHPESGQWVLIWDAAVKDWNFLKSPVFLAQSRKCSLPHDTERLFSLTVMTVSISPDLILSLLPIPPPFHCFSLLLILVFLCSYFSPG